MANAKLKTAKPAKAKAKAKAKPQKATPRGGADAELARAAAARSASDRLALTLDAWRQRPALEIAAAVMRASAIAAAGREAIAGLDHAERQQQWLKVEKVGDAADVERLLAVLVDTRCEHAIQRVKKLAARPHDPRLVEQLVRYIEADPSQSRGETSPVPFTSQPNRAFWTLLLALVKERADASVCARLRAVARRNPTTEFERWLAKQCTAIAETIASREPPPVSAGERAALAALDKALAASEAEHQPAADTGDALFAAVWAAPDDDAPRLVLADFLSGRGDPRGELIALQLARAAGTLDPAGRKREKELLKRHKKQWLGPIAPLIQPHALRFERGFLVTCFLEPNAELEKTLGNHPAWATIREYYFHAYAKDTAKPLVKMLEAHGATFSSSFTRGIE